MENFGTLRVVGFEPFVGEDDADAAVQEREFAQTLGEDIPHIDHIGKNRRIRLEGDLRAALRGRPELLELHRRDAALETNPVRLAAAVDFDLHPVGQRVHAGDADAVQAARNLIGVMVEFAARMQDGQHDFDGRFALAFVDIDRNAAPVVLDRDRIIRMNVTATWLAYPASASSIELSTTS